MISENLQRRGGKKFLTSFHILYSLTVPRRVCNAKQGFLTQPCDTHVSLNLASISGSLNACFSGFLTFFHQVAPRSQVPAAGTEALEVNPRSHSFFPFPSNPVFLPGRGRPQCSEADCPVSLSGSPGPGIDKTLIW